MANVSLTRAVLLVESDVALRERWYDVLTRDGVYVIAASSGVHAKEILTHEHPALVITDTVLPDTTSWALADHIRSFDSQLPILVLDHSPNPDLLSQHHVQAAVSPHAPDQVLLDEVRHWQLPLPSTDHHRWPGMILIVDDELKLRAVLQAFLESHGFMTSGAASGEDALQQLAQSSPTAVLLDIKMQGMDGLLTLKKMKRLRPHLTVIVITATADRASLDEALRLGAHDYIVKPFNLEHLETVLLSTLLLGRAA